MMNAAVVMPPPIKSPVTYNHNISILWSSIMAGKLHVKKYIHMKTMINVIVTTPD
uniref:Uncharacterized protein n=1 Tax=Anguilla anguilla TaxID=7936 RepID=A0A0E9PE43_ANGAN